MATLMLQKIGSDPVRRCDATCHNAKKPKCACICGGRYHGKGTGTPELAQAVKDFGDQVLGRDLHEQMTLAFQADGKLTPELNDRFQEAVRRHYGHDSATSAS